MQLFQYILEEGLLRRVVLYRARRGRRYEVRVLQMPGSKQERWHLLCKPSTTLMYVCPEANKDFTPSSPRES